MRHCVRMLILVAFWPTVLLAAFSHPATSPMLASCGETLAQPSFSAGMILHTPASVCLCERASVEFAAQRLYSLSELDSYLAAGAARYGRLGFGAAFLSMGESELYLEMTATGCIGYAFSDYLCAGLSLGFNRIDMGDQYGSVNSHSLAVGAMVLPSSYWSAYATIRNPFEPEIVSDSKLHGEVSAGIVVTRFDNVSLALEVDSRAGDDIRYKIGDVYRLSDMLSVSAGIMTSPFVPSFGCRITLSRFGLLYAYRYHSDLGGTHVWGIEIAL